MTVPGWRAEGRGAAKGRWAPGLALRLCEGQRALAPPCCVSLRASFPPPKVPRAPRHGSRPRCWAAAMMAAGHLHREQAQRCGPGRSAQAKSCRCCPGKPSQVGVQGQGCVRSPAWL